MGRRDKAAGLPYKLRSGLWHFVNVNEALQSPSEGELFAQAARDMEAFGQRNLASSPRRGYQNWWDPEFANLETRPASSRSPSPPSSGLPQQRPFSQYQPFRPPQNPLPYPRSPGSLRRSPPSPPQDGLHSPPTLPCPVDTPRRLVRKPLNPNAEQFQSRRSPPLDPGANEFQPQRPLYPLVGPTEIPEVIVREPAGQNTANPPSRIPRPIHRSNTSQVSRKPVSRLPRPVKNARPQSSRKVLTSSNNRQPQEQPSMELIRPKFNDLLGNQRQHGYQSATDQRRHMTAPPSPMSMLRTVNSTTRSNGNGNRQVSQRPRVEPVAAAPTPLTTMQPTRAGPQPVTQKIDDVLVQAAYPSSQPDAPQLNTSEVSLPYSGQPPAEHGEWRPQRPSSSRPSAPQDRTSMPLPVPANGQGLQQSPQRPQTWQPEAAPALEYHNLGFVAPLPSTTASPVLMTTPEEDRSAEAFVTISEQIIEWCRSHPGQDVTPVVAEWLARRACSDHQNLDFVAPLFPTAGPPIPSTTLEQYRSAQLLVHISERIAAWRSRHPEADANAAVAEWLARRTRSVPEDNSLSPRPSDEDEEENKVQRPFSVRINLLENLSRGIQRYANHVKMIKE